jgi:hypothetical protein
MSTVSSLLNAMKQWRRNIHNATAGFDDDDGPSLRGLPTGGHIMQYELRRRDLRLTSGLTAQLDGAWTRICTQVVDAAYALSDK